MNHWYDATKWVPANGRGVIVYWELERNPFHGIAHFDHEEGEWIQFDDDGAHVLDDLDRWTELPYPSDATNPPSFEVIPL